ncbi:MAG: VPLPA-CTERM sorting domain-containing protein [Woeseiaceae bacterium]
MKKTRKPFKAVMFSAAIMLLSPQLVSAGIVSFTFTETLNGLTRLSVTGQVDGVLDYLDFQQFQSEFSSPSELSSLWAPGYVGSTVVDAFTTNDIKFDYLDLGESYYFHYLSISFTPTESSLIAFGFDENGYRGDDGDPGLLFSGEALFALDYDTVFGADRVLEYAISPTDSMRISTVGISTVPVPAAAWLFGSGLLGLVGMARRKRA